MTRRDVSTPALVLHFHHGSLGIARSLGRWGVSVYGVDRHASKPELASRYLAGSFRWDLKRRSAEESVEYLLDVGRGLGSRVVLIPTSDDTVQLVADHAEALAERFLFPRIPPSLVRSLSNKRDLYFLAKSHRVPTPETAFPHDRDEAVWLASEMGFPVVLKAADGLRLQARTGRKMVIVRTPEELLREYDRLEDPEDPNLMIQEYIPGGDDTIWMFEGYFGDDSECLAGFTGRKLRQYPVHVGATSLGELVCSPMVDRTTRRFMKALGYRGMLDIGYRFDARDGSYKLLDPNPRVGSTFRLFVGEDHMDVVRLMYLDLTGQTVPAIRPRWGRRWLIEDRDLFSSLEYAREGTLTLGAWARSLRGVEELAWFAWDDPLPALHTFGGVQRRLRSAAWRRARAEAGARLSGARSRAAALPLLGRIFPGLAQDELVRPKP